MRFGKTCAVFIGLMALVGPGCGLMTDLPDPDEVAREAGEGSGPENQPGPEGLVTDPSLVSSRPAGGQTDVAIDTAVFLEFSEPMEVNALEVRLSPDHGLGAPAWGEGDKTVTLQPAAPLETGANYEIIVSGKTKAGRTLQTSVIPFTTVGNPEPAERPALVSTEPANAATQVESGTGLTLAFSIPMNPESVQVGINPTAQLGAATWSDGDTILSFESPALAAQTKYTVTVSGTATNGEALAEGVSFSFTTAAVPQPATPPVVASANPPNDARGISRTPSLVVNFSKAMNRGSVEQAFMRPAAGTFSWNAQSTVVTFKLSNKLAAGATVTWGVEGTAKDAQGTALGARFSRRFRAVQERTVELTAIASLEASLSDSGRVVTAASTAPGNTTIEVGDGPQGNPPSGRYAKRGFFTFDLRRVPPEATGIAFAELTLNRASLWGNPYALGPLSVDGVSYGAGVEGADFHRGTTHPGPAWLLGETGNGLGFVRYDVTGAARSDLSKRKERGNRTQYRAFMRNDVSGKDSYQDSVFIWSSLTGDASKRPKLRVTYEFP